MNPPDLTFRQAITENSIRAMVDSFYDKVRKDELLAPVFERSLGSSWETHLPRMADFWSRILLDTRRFHGNVFGTHMALDGLTDEHFVRWLALFRETVCSMFAEPQAGDMVVTAERIANSLKLGYADRRPGNAVTRRDSRFHVIAEPGQ